MFGFVLQFTQLVKKHGVQIVSNENAFNEVKLIEEAFERYTQYLYHLVKHLAYKGMFKELYLRLDFNKYYDKGDS